MTITQLITIFALLGPAAIDHASVIENSTPEWAQKEFQIQALDLPTDRYCGGHYLITALLKSGFPVNSERHPIVKGKDIVLGINSAFSDTEKVWIDVPRKTPWQKLESDNGKAKAADIIRHYAEQAGEYRVTYVGSLVVLLPKDTAALCESINLPPLDKSQCTLFDLRNTYWKDLEPYHVGFHFAMPGSADYGKNISFDMSFAGGSLKQLLCQAVLGLDSADPLYYHFWTIGGLEGQMGIRFGRVSRKTLEMIMVEEE
ncbi:MAG TPA: hypothetical protein PLQ35_18245 [bacterium]|nr:hypothetical protein [bacterium]